MARAIEFIHDYGYVAMEELIFRVIALALLPNWFGIILVSGLLFGACHYWISWLAVLGTMGAGLLFGYLYVFVIPFPLNVIAVVGLHLLWAVFGDKWL